jgi:phospholipid transport system substrate-binding protein
MFSRGRARSLPKKLINAEEKMQPFKPKNAPVVVLLMVLLSPYPARAGIPSDQLRQTTDKVLAILQDPQFKSPAKIPQRRDRLRQVIATRFDFPEMAKRSLGSNWQRLNSAEQRQFVQLFTDLLERTYSDQIEAFDGEKIVYGREQQNENQAEVDTKIITKKGEAFSVNYKLLAADQQWKIYDVVIEDVSLVNNYRSQFNRMLGNSSSEDFLRKLRERPAGKDKG